MASVGKVVTTSCLYDINDERIAEGANGATTTYPFPFYNVGTSSGRATYTKHIFANGEPVADVQGSTTTAKVYYIHDDALGGANVLSNASGTVADVIEYYPFGGIRLNQQVTSFGEQRRFTGHEFDPGTGLNYMDARYEGPSLGRFLSEDAAINNLGTPGSGGDGDPNVASAAGFLDQANSNNSKLVALLTDPQQLNYYSYARNNPLRYTDPTGNLTQQQQTAVNSVISAFSRGSLSTSQIMALSQLSTAFGGGQVGSFMQNHPIASAAIGASIVSGAWIATTPTFGAALLRTAPTLVPTAKALCDKYCPEADEISQGVSRWPHPDDGRAVINGIEYSQHALGRMMPEGMQWIDTAGKTTEGRGVPPTVVQNAIQYGSQASSYGNSIIHTYENVRVITDAVTGVVQTIMKLGH